ncbi:hypothetical protein P367_20385 [Comamonas thiooxydans]|nr:hypothetical protein P369_23735 [Comamonas thiooxydans]KGG96354.1 hypothetical protein P367_20385 [Comamonas thiooxydans]
MGSREKPAGKAWLRRTSMSGVATGPDMPETAAIVKSLDEKQNQYIFLKYTNKIYEC